MSQSRKPPNTPKVRSGTEMLVLGLFFLSGASALIYEVVWSRLLTFIFGGTAFAIATVLASYMAGLALGSWIFGKRIDRTGHPLKVYAILEAGIALWALLLPLVLDVLDGFYGFLYREMHPGPYALSLIRFALSFVVLLVPTILMGGTLPVLSKLLVSGRKTVGLKAGLLYGTNTIGAVVGVASAGFLLIPTFGMAVSTWIAIAFNALVVFLAFLIAKSIPWHPTAEARQKADAADSLADAAERDLAPVSETSARVRKIVLYVYAASGFAALAYEVAWTKVLAGALGSSTYAFSAMLTTFLLGLALGAFIFARLADRHDPARLLAWSQLTIALLGLAALPLFGNLPILFVQVFKSWGPSWGAQTLAKFALCAVSMLPPTLLMGGTFPLVARIYADRSGKMGEQVGRLYASNTFGAILGSFSAGFILIPLLGRQGTILAAAAVNVISAALLYFTLLPTLSRRARIVAAATAVLLLPLVVIGARPWDRHLLTSGAFIYAESLAREPDVSKAMHAQRIIYFKEETEAIIAVMQTEQVISLRTNGKVEASSAGDMLTQKMISHLPLFFHPEAKDVLMIGLASGISLGSVTTHPEVEKIDCVEMLAAMREASDFFRKYNHDVLDDPRTSLIINDGRNHLQLSRDTHDVIISQPSNPWIVGIGSLFTREFFELGKSRLKPNGVFCQWVQTYQMSRRDFGSVLKTFQESFPHVSVWMGNAGDVILLGSVEPVMLDYARLDREIRTNPELARDLRTINIFDVEGVLQSYIGGPRALATLIAPGSRTITDDNLLLEFSMPRNIHSPTTEMMALPLLTPAREPYPGVISTAGLPADSAASVEARFVRYYQGRSLGIDGINMNFGSDHANAVRTLEQAYALAPTDPLIGHFLAASRNEIGIRLLQGGQERQALLEFTRAAQVGSTAEAALALNNIGLHHYREGRLDSAGHYWETAAKLEPENPTIRFNLGLVYDNSGRDDLAAAEYRAALASDPENPVILNNLAWILAHDAATAAEAPSFSARAIALNRTPGNLDTHGWALYKAGRTAEAETALREAVSLAANDMEALFHLAIVLAGNGKRDEARGAFEKVVQADSDGDLARLARQNLEGL